MLVLRPDWIFYAVASETGRYIVRHNLSSKHHERRYAEEKLGMGRAREVGGVPCG